VVSPVPALAILYITLNSKPFIAVSINSQEKQTIESYRSFGYRSATTRISNNSYGLQIDSKKVAHISAVVMLRRSDKRKDRVEISPEQLTNAAIQADKLTHELGQPMRVLGWYHSHPHITVWPSHVGKNIFSRKLAVIIYVLLCGAKKKTSFQDIPFANSKMISVCSRYVILFKVHTVM